MVKEKNMKKKVRLLQKKLKPIVKILEVTPSIKEFNIAFKGMVRTKFCY